MKADGFVFFVAALALFASALGTSLTEEECGPSAVWQDNNNTDWFNAENWADAKVPTELSKVLLLEASAVTVLSNNDKVQVSSARIGSQSLLKITSGSKLKIFNREIQCFDTNWCSGNGECVGLNECQCEPGWTGAACDQQDPSVCHAGSVDACGLCKEGGIVCSCGEDVLGQPQEYLSRLLVLDTNSELQAAIAETTKKLAHLKNLTRRYDPYTETLAEEIAAWIAEVQDFTDNSLAGFAEAADEDLVAIDSVVPIADPCDATEAQADLEQMFN